MVGEVSDGFQIVFVVAGERQEEVSKASDRWFGWCWCYNNDGRGKGIRLDKLKSGGLERSILSSLAPF